MGGLSLQRRLVFGPRGGAGWRWALVCLCNGSGTGAACPCLPCWPRPGARAGSAEQGVHRAGSTCLRVCGLLVILGGKAGAHRAWMWDRSTVSACLLKAELRSQRGSSHTKVFYLVPSPRSLPSAHQPPTSRTSAQAAWPSRGHHRSVCTGVSPAAGCPPARAGPPLTDLTCRGSASRVCTAEPRGAGGSHGAWPLAPRPGKLSRAWVLWLWCREVLGDMDVWEFSDVHTHTSASPGTTAVN